MSKSITSYDLSVGKILTKGKLFTSVSAGIGLVRGVYPGNLISREGIWFFPHYTYERNRYTIVGIPVSIKSIWVPGRVYGIGLDLYANFNKKNIFYGINLSHQFGRLNPDKKKKVKKK